MAIVNLCPENSWMLDNQQHYTPAQREFAIASPHFCYVLAKRISIQGEKRRAVFERERGHCYHCSVEIDYTDYHVDHLFPISLGGSDDMDNLAASCPPCNLAKGAKV